MTQNMWSNQMFNGIAIWIMKVSETYAQHYPSCFLYVYVIVKWSCSFKFVNTFTQTYSYVGTTKLEVNNLSYFRPQWRKLRNIRTSDAIENLTYGVKWQDNVMMMSKTMHAMQERRKTKGQLIENNVRRRNIWRRLDPQGSPQKLRLPKDSWTPSFSEVSLECLKTRRFQLLLSQGTFFAHKVMIFAGSAQLMYRVLHEMVVSVR